MLTGNGDVPPPAAGGSALRYPTIVCPIDFSDQSRSSLCYAAAIADHFGARLVMVAVDDPLLVQAAAASGVTPSLTTATEAELRRVCGKVLDRLGPGARTVDYRVAVGKPASEILRIAEELSADLIVMSSRGRSGVRKLFFGSTTERVLRETAVPVLVTPDERERAISLSDLARHVQRVIVPVDLTEASPHQVRIGTGIATALAVPLILTHVMEPIFIPQSLRLAMPGADAGRRAEAQEHLDRVAATAGATTSTETIVLTGEPSEEIVKLADTRGAHLVVMGLHSSGLLGPRMGSVTYRVLCLTKALVLAVPPVHAGVTGEPPTRAAHAPTVAGA